MGQWQAQKKRNGYKRRWERAAGGVLSAPRCTSGDTRHVSHPHTAMMPLCFFRVFFPVRPALKLPKAPGS
jgi:hypothetical protein